MNEDMQAFIEKMQIEAEKGIFETALRYGMREALEYLAFYLNAPHHKEVKKLFDDTNNDRDKLGEHFIVKLPIFRQLVKDYIKEYFENNGMVTQSCMRGWSKLSNNMLSTNEA